MAFVAPFRIGETVTNAQIVESFKVGNMGGMRRSKKTNTLVIICDHTKGLYDDKWYGDVLHYTGMGKVGDQTLAGNQNGTLYNSSTNGVAVHLFEGMLFSFDLQKSSELVFDKTAVEYMIKNKRKLLNSDLKAWAMFLEEIEDKSKAIDIAQKMGFNYIESRVNIYWLLLSTLFNEDLC